jgi:hypothetical protein
VSVTGGAAAELTLDRATTALVLIDLQKRILPTLGRVRSLDVVIAAVERLVRGRRHFLQMKSFRHILACDDSLHSRPH